MQNLLPTFDVDDEDEDEIEKQHTLEMLFHGENFYFGNPLLDFQARLAKGEFSPESVKTQKMLRRIAKRRFKEKTKERAYSLLQEMLTSRFVVYGLCKVKS